MGTRSALPRRSSAGSGQVGAVEKPGEPGWGTGWPLERGSEPSTLPCPLPLCPACQRALAQPPQTPRVQVMASPTRDPDQPPLRCSLTPTSSCLGADSSRGGEWDHRATGSCCELFAASLGNLKWLRFCLVADREEIPTNNKVRPWRAGARTEVHPSPPGAAHIAVTWQRASRGVFFWVGRPN